MSSRLVSRALDEAERPPAEWAASYLSGFFAGPVAQELIDELLAIMGDTRPAGIRAMVQAFAAADLRDVLSTVAVPTFLIYGERDERSPRAVADDLHTSIPESQLVVIPGVGHVGNIEAPELFDVEVRPFLRAVRS